MVPQAKDYNQNGSIDSEDVEIFNNAVKLFGQLTIASVSLIAILILTVVLCTDIISLERIKVLEGIFTTVYIALSSLVGAQMGISVWMSNKR